MLIERFMLSEDLADKIFEITGVDYSSMLNLKDVENLIKDLICEYYVIKEKK